MPLDDVWKNLEHNIEIHWTGRFDEVPEAAGVYAWFYPLRVTSLDLGDFIAEVRKVHLYDARTESPPKTNSRSRLGWSVLDWSAEFQSPEVDPPWKMQQAWEKIAGDSSAFENLRRVLLTASLLMPPLYVGKAVDLRTRCHQHLSGASGFADRFERYADSAGFHARRVQDLVFVAIRTEAIGTSEDEAEKLVEEILKLVGRPPYGVV
jgi:hypothetical protein